MMMDVGMYGHNHHGNSYNPDPNFFGYTEAANQHPSHYPYQYEDQQFIYPPSDVLDAPPSPNDLNYYSQQIHPPENPIINTDTGLSYTNLDYGHSNPGYPPNYDPYQRGPQDVHIRHPDEVASSNGLYTGENKYSLGHEMGYHPHFGSAGSPSSSCMEYQHLQRYKEDVEGDRLKNHHLQGISPAPTQQPSLPTYKWMHVKRNVPKPTGEFHHSTVLFISEGREK